MDAGGKITRAGAMNLILFVNQDLTQESQGGEAYDKKAEAWELALAKLVGTIA